MLAGGRHGDNPHLEAGSPPRPQLQPRSAEGCLSSPDHALSTDSKPQTQSSPVLKAQATGPPATSLAPPNLFFLHQQCWKPSAFPEGPFQPPASEMSFLIFCWIQQAKRPYLGEGKQRPELNNPWKGYSIWMALRPREGKEGVDN